MKSDVTIHQGWLKSVVGLLLINRLRDVPRSLGLPPIEKYKPSRNGNINNNAETDQYELPSDSAETSLSTKQILIEHRVCTGISLVHKKT